MPPPPLPPPAPSTTAGPTRPWRTDRLVHNGLMLAATTAVSGVLGFAGWAVAARAMPPSAVGTASGLVAAMTMAMLVANLGIGTALVQELPTVQDPEAWMRTATGACRCAAGFGAIAGILVTGIVAVAVPDLFGDGWRAAALLAVGTLTWTVALAVDFVFMADRRGGYVLARNAVFAVTKLTATVALAATDHATAVSVYAVWVAATGLSIAFGITWFGRLGHGPLRTGRARPAWSRLRTTALGNFGVNLGAQVPGYVIPLVIVAEQSTRSNAYYQAAFMSCAFLAAWSPAVSSSLLAEGSHGRELRAALRTTTRLLLATLLPGVCAFVLARHVILGLFGEVYRTSAQGLFVLLAVGTLPDAVSNVCIVAMRIDRRFRSATLLNATIGITMVVGSAALLPVLGLAGVGWAWIVAQTIGAAWAALDLARRPRRLAS